MKSIVEKVDNKSGGLLVLIGGAAISGVILNEYTKNQVQSWCWAFIF